MDSKNNEKSMTAEEDAALLALLDKFPEAEARRKEVARVAKGFSLPFKRVNSRAFMLKKLPEREKRRIRKLAREDPKHVVVLGNSQRESRIVNVYFPGRLPQQSAKTRGATLNREDEMVARFVAEGGVNDQLKERVEEWRKTLAAKGPLATQLNARVLASLIKHFSEVYGVPANDILKRFCRGSNGLRMDQVRAKLQRGAVDPE